MKSSLKNWPLAIFVFLAAALSLGAHDNSPSNWQVLPEVIWAPATGGGTWNTEVQIIDCTQSGGSKVTVYFFYGNGNIRGPFILWWAPDAAYQSGKFNNILKNVQDWFDPGFNYYGKVGAMWFLTQDINHKILVTARTVNGNYSKTLPGLNTYDLNTANVDRLMVIPNLAQHSQYRSTVGIHNMEGSSIYVRFALVDSTNHAIGSEFYMNFVAHDFQAFYPFAEAGVPTGAYDNVWLIVQPISGTGKLFCFGATANNTTNDPAAHIAVQFH